MWVYTEYGQRRAELFGNNNRKAGQPALPPAAWLP